MVSITARAQSITAPTASEPKTDVHEGAAFAAYIENDARVLGGPGTDRAYSNGFKFSYIYAQDGAPEWARKPFNIFKFLDNDLDLAKSNFAVSFAQQIYTPNNTALTQLISDDRPYVAWMYLGFGFTFKEEKVAHFLEVDVGTVGPSALGEQVQNDFHDLVHDEHAVGWANGLKDEPTLQLFYQDRYKYLREKYFDFVPYYGAGLGNVQIAIHAGGIVRIGFNLPDDFGPTRPSASDGDSFVSPTGEAGARRNSAYIFGGIRGNAVARNIFLDGNSFRASHKVTKYPFTSDTEVGFGLQFTPMSFVWSFVVRSPEFEQQSKFNSFASINMIYAL